MNENEQKIIQSCKKGKHEDFALLYDLYIGKIYRFIYYKTHHKETAEDLTSETFLKALRKINSFDSERGSFSTWLYQIARNTVVDYYRTRKLYLNVDDAWDLKDDTDIMRDVEFVQKLKKVEQYLKKLKPEQREIIIMRVWQNMNYCEIAEVLNKSEASCKMIFSRTIRTLRKEMFAAFILFLFISLNF